MIKIKDSYAEVVLKQRTKITVVLTAVITNAALMYGLKDNLFVVSYMVLSALLGIVIYLKTPRLGLGKFFMFSPLTLVVFWFFVSVVFVNIWSGFWTGLTGG